MQLTWSVGDLDADEETRNFRRGPDTFLLFDGSIRMNHRNGAKEQTATDEEMRKLLRGFVLVHPGAFAYIKSPTSQQCRCGECNEAGT